MGQGGCDGGADRLGPWLVRGGTTRRSGRWRWGRTVIAAIAAAAAGVVVWAPAPLPAGSWSESSPRGAGGEPCPGWSCSPQRRASGTLQPVTVDEERIALFLDYENLAIGARDHLKGFSFDFKPIADALAERGRVVVRRAYADWSSWGEDRRMTRSHVELIEIPQRMGASRKNAADIKMSVDALELAFERLRDHLVLCTATATSPRWSTSCASSTSESSGWASAAPPPICSRHPATSSSSTTRSRVSRPGIPRRDAPPPQSAAGGRGGQRTTASRPPPI